MTKQDKAKEMSDLDMRFEDLSLRLLDTFPHNGGVPPALLLTSARRGEGKTTMALAMARVMALGSGEPILLVDANFHNPGLAKALRLAPSPGLADALREPNAEIDMPKHPVIDGVSLICAGINPEPLLLTRGKAIASFRERYTQAFRFIIFDGAESRLGGAALAKHVDGVALTIDASVTRREVINGAISDMRLHEGRLIGAILNKRRHYIPAFLYKSF
jgi:Mrp family chromosome partitioning ATPase